mmetsp:Transcript_38708/g.90598  ORF Transcript_38708/g.90598 Transcript_38708/m.90598 type:complete len:231 (-) Transcript_38708:1788-2480(-)
MEPTLLRRLAARIDDAGLDARALHQRLRRGLELPAVRGRHRAGLARCLCAARRRLARHEDRGRVAGPRYRLGASGLVAGGAGHGADLDGHAVDQHHGARALVRTAADHRAAGDSRHHRGRAAGVAPRVADAPGARRTVLAALRAADRRVRARLRRSRLQHLSLRGDRQADHVAGRQQPGHAEGDAHRRMHFGAGDRCLHHLLVPRVRRQGHGVALWIADGAGCWWPATGR